eukprot:3755167-Amphidinium_carterae.1
MQVQINRIARSLAAANSDGLRTALPRRADSAEQQQRQQKLEELAEIEQQLDSLRRSIAAGDVGAVGELGSQATSSVAQHVGPVVERGALKPAPKIKSMKVMHVIHAFQETRLLAEASASTMTHSDAA